MSLSIAVISYLVAIVATFLLSVYFFREYFVKKLRASLAWAIGLLLITLALLTDLSVVLVGEVAVGKPMIAIGLAIVAVGMTFLYYGTSLLFFSERYFFREKMTILIIIILTVYFGLLLTILPVENFRQAALVYVQWFAMSPIYLVIAFLFYRGSKAFSSSDYRRRILLLVSGGWGLVTLNSLGRYFLGNSVFLDSIIHLILALGWILILYGMVLGKATRA